MTIGFAVPFVDEALGHSVIYDEYKGNYAEARTLAEQALDQARAEGDPAQLADALLARGVVHLLQGETALAMSCLDEIQRAVPSDPERCLCAESFQWLVVASHFNTFPEGSGANATEISARWHSVAYMQEEEPRWKALLGQSRNGLVQLESWLAHQVLPALKPVRSILQTSRYSPPVSSIQDVLQGNLQSLQGFRQGVNSIGGDTYLIAYADLAAADLCHRYGDTARATAFLQSASGVYQQGGDKKGFATSQMVWGDWLSAPYSTPIVLNLAMQESSSENSNLSWTLEAEEFTKNGMDLEGAAKAYALAENLYREANSLRGLAATQLRYGYLQMLNGDYAAAVKCAQAAAEGFHSSGDLLGYMLARVHRVIGRVGAGEFPEETETVREIGDWGAKEGSFSYTLGLGILISRAARHWLLREGDYERALACYRLAETLFRSLGATTNAAQSLVDQAGTYHAVGERTAALTLYEQALDLYTEDQTARPQIAENLRQRVMMLAVTVYQLYLQVMDADGMERSAGRIQQQLAAMPGGGIDLKAMTELLSRTLSTLGSGDAGSTLPSGIENWALSQMGRSTVEQANVLVPLYRGQQARDSGQKVKADALFQQAMWAARSAGSDQKDFLEATILAMQKQYDLAVAAFERHLSKGGADAGLAGQLTNLMTTVGGELGQREARQQQRRTFDEAFTFMVNSKAYPQAKNYLDQIEKLAGADWWAEENRPWDSLDSIAEMWEGLGKWETALHYYDLAIDELERRRTRLSRDELKSALAAEKGVQYLYFGAARTALRLLEKEQGPNATARAAQVLAYCERGKARALLDLMASSAAIAKFSQAESGAMRAWRQLNAQISLRRTLLAQERSAQSASPERIEFLSKQIEADEQELKKAEGALAGSNPEFYRSINPQAQILGLDELCPMLTDDTAVLQYYFLGDDLLAWAITREGMVQHHRATIDSAALNRQIQALHHTCEARLQPGDLDKTLADLLLAPFHETIRNHSELLIVPYAAAHALPFHVLPWEGQPLIATHAVSFLPSVSTLQFTRRDPTKKLGDRILLVGNPANMSYQPPFSGAPKPLPGLAASEAEAVYVGSLFPQSRVLTGKAATEEALRELIGSYPLVHLATHGYLAEDAPLLSSILLAEGGALTVYELMGLGLSADLIVLSACHTAEGETTRGDDVVGFARGLLGTGARGAVLSLWAVDDYSTALLMGEFYTQLIAGASPQRALQLAQNYSRTLSRAEIDAGLKRIQAMIVETGASGSRQVVPTGAAGGDDSRESRGADYSHPYFWAPFVLVGAND